MKPNKVRLFSKAMCSWCQEAAAWLDQHGITYEKLDIGDNPAARAEMVQLSKQSLVPVIDVDGKILADFDTRQLEAFLAKHGYQV